MAKVIVQSHVADYDRWYPVFVEHGEVRRGHGATGHVVYRTVEDPNTLVIVNDFPTADGARAFMTDPSLKDAMERAGVDSVPQIWLCDEVESQRY
jgi:uncharacterized protein YndB with AHSA1/START domain